MIRDTWVHLKIQEWESMMTELLYRHNRQKRQKEQGGTHMPSRERCEELCDGTKRTATGHITPKIRKVKVPESCYFLDRTCSESQEGMSNSVRN